MSPQTLNSEFLSLPKKIKEWLSSEQLVYIISDISARLGLAEGKKTAIPKLILRLAVKDLNPTDFINELSGELKIDFKTAQAIADDIEKKALRPIETELKRETGVDVKLIYFGKPAAKPQAPAAEKPIVETKIPAIPVPQITVTPIPPPPPQIPEKPKPIENPKAKPEEPVVDLESFKIKGPLPFMLHRETAAYATPTPEELLKIKSTMPTPPPMFAEKPKIEIPEPKTAKLEISITPSPIIAKISPTISSLAKEQKTVPLAQSQPQFKNQTVIESLLPTPAETSAEESQKIRVVHYSGFRTPLNNIGTPKPDNQNTVDLRKFSNNKGDESR